MGSEQVRQEAESEGYKTGIALIVIGLVSALFVCAFGIGLLIGIVLPW